MTSSYSRSSWTWPQAGFSASRPRSRQPDPGFRMPRKRKTVASSAPTELVTRQQSTALPPAADEAVITEHGDDTLPPPDACEMTEAGQHGQPPADAANARRGPVYAADPCPGMTVNLGG